jgi:ubiquinone/menaquinone biosynthesis C-methylase UbiE
MSDPLAQVATWNLVADDYLESIVPHFEHYAADALALAAPKPEAEILDVACGPGTLTLLAARKVARVVAVDFSEEMITRLRERAGRAALRHVDARVGDGRALEFPDRRFDAGFSMFGIFLFEGRGQGLRELKRVLRPGAPAVISSWITAERPRVLTMVRQAGFEEAGTSVPPEPALGTSDEMREELSAVGFNNVRVERSAHAIEFQGPDGLWNWLSRSLVPLILLRRQLGEEGFRPVEGRIRKSIEREFSVGRQHLEMPAWLGYGVA